MKKETTEKQVVTEDSEQPDIYYVVNIYDNHGTINISQSGQPIPPPTPPPKP